MGSPAVTFIMPAYNAEQYIAEAIESVIRQTFGDWEMIVVDDCSTDTTRSIAEGFAAADSRIKVISTDAPTGSAYQPRKKGITLAKGEFVAPLDADDTIGPHYLERLLGRMAQTASDAVYPTLWTGERRLTNKTSELMDGVYAGKECVKFTLNGWGINCGGGVIRKSLYMEAFRRFDSSITWVCADELLSRQLLYLAGRVAFSEEKYHYRMNPDSVTRKKSGKMFDFQINDHLLIDYARQWYGKESEEYALAQLQNFHGYFDGTRLLSRYDFTRDDERAGIELLKQSKALFDRDILRERAGKRYYALSLLPFSIMRVVLKAADRIMGKQKITKR